MMKPQELKPKPIQERLNDLQKEVGNLLRTYRYSRGIQSEFVLAKALGFGDSTLYKIEKGEVIPSKRTLLDLKKVYELSNDQFKQVLKLVEDAKILKKAIRDHNKGVM